MKNGTTPPSRTNANSVPVRGDNTKLPGRDVTKTPTQQFADFGSPEEGYYVGSVPASYQFGAARGVLKKSDDFTKVTSSNSAPVIVGFEPSSQVVEDDDDWTSPDRLRAEINTLKEEKKTQSASAPGAADGKILVPQPKEKLKTSHVEQVTKGRSPGSIDIQKQRVGTEDDMTAFGPETFAARTSREDALKRANERKESLRKADNAPTGTVRTQAGSLPPANKTNTQSFSK